MNSRDARLTAILLFVLLAANAFWLSPELTVSRVDLNDNILHFSLIQRTVQTIERGGNPLDFWSPEVGLGYPVIRTYQPLAHLLVAGVYFLLGKSVDLMTVFVWFRFLALVLLPLSFFAAMRLMGFAPWTALAGAMLSPLLSTNFLYGLDFNSFTWSGSGLFPQLVAAHLLLWSLGAGCRAVRRGRGLTLAGLLLALTFLAHLIYGYMGAMTVCLMAILPDPESGIWVRIRRVLWIGAATFAAVAFQLVPMLRDANNINHSVWEPAWKWDSYSAAEVMSRLFTGQLLDYGRIPVLTILAFAGAAMLYWKRDWLHWFAAAGAAFWTALYLGRAFWGPVLTLVGVSPDMHLHRVIGGVQIFLLLLAALALAELWTFLSRRWNAAVAAAATAILLTPMVWERAIFVSHDDSWGENNLTARADAQSDIDTVLAKVAGRGGRVYAGLAASWGHQFRVGDVPWYGIFSGSQVPTLGFLYHSMSLSGDVMLRFDQKNPAHYRLFNVRSMLTPAPPEPGLPPFVVPLEAVGRFQLYDTPGGGYFDLVDVPAFAKTTRLNFFDLNERWLASDWVAARTHLWLDWNGDAPARLQRRSPDDPLPSVTPPPPAGEAHGDRRNSEVYEADLDVLRECFALFKMTWHRNWHAYIDGVRTPAGMLSPGFVGVPVGPGHHHIVMRYEPGNGKLLAALAGAILLLFFALAERRGLAEKWQPSLVSFRPGYRWTTAGGLALLALPVCIPLFTSKVVWGHDAFCYFSRLMELHQNVTSGILLPRWAPDFGSGTGQPLFIFHPPLFYWLAEIFHAAGFSFTTAVNVACVVIVMASAAAIYLLANLYFGSLGGWLAAAAYLYAPYFAIDLYVRSALEEFTCFPLLALSMYGFAAFAQLGKRRHWLLGVAAYAAIVFASFPAALLYSPLVAAFLAFTAWRAGSWKLLAKQAGGMGFGLALAAAVWLPAMLERSDVWMDRVLDGYQRYGNHFVAIWQLIHSRWGYGESVAGHSDGMSFSLGLGHLFLAAMAFLWMERRGKPEGRWLTRFFAAAGTIACLLMIEQVEWLWDRLPLLQYVELPWRLMGPATLCLAMLTAALAPAVAGWGRDRRVILAGIFLLLILPNVGHLQPKAFHDVDLALWTPQQMAARGWESTSQGEVTPRAVEVTPFYNPAPAEITSGEALIRPISRGAFSWSGAVSAKSDSVMRLSTAYFPGWEVRLDGKPAEIRPAMLSGLIQFSIPAGEHRADAVWRGTALERWSELFSLLVLGVWLALLAVTLRSKGI